MKGQKGSVTRDDVSWGMGSTKMWKELPNRSPAGYLCRVFQKTIEDGHLTVIVGREPHGPAGRLAYHLSISHRLNHILNSMGVPVPGRLPKWEEIVEARYEFCPNEVYMAMILPPMEEYINLHPTTMHLYEIPGDEGK